MQTEQLTASAPHWGIRTRLAWLVCGLLLALVTIVAISVELQRRGHALLATVYADRLVPLARLKAVSDAYAVDVVDTVHKVRDATLEPAAGAAIIVAARLHAQNQWRLYLATFITPEEQQLIDAAAPLLQQANDLAARAEAAMRAADRAALHSLAAGEMYPAIDPLSQALRQLVALQERVADELLQGSRASARTKQVALFALALTVVLAAGWASWRIVRSVTQPLSDAVRLAEAVAGGALQTRITAARHDEVGQLLAAVDRMRGTLVRLVDTDALTGLITRRRFDELALAECQRAQRQPGPWAVLMIDLDHFKQVNDTYGHAGGDEVLRAAARALRSALRAQDSAARYGGEELAALLPGADARVALQVGERVREAIAQLSVAYGEQHIRVTASVGAAAWAGEAPEHTAQVLRRADAALYSAKSAGRNRAVGQGSPVAPPPIIRPDA